MGSRSLAAACVTALAIGLAVPAFAASEGQALYTALQGTFKNATGGSCDMPFYKSGAVNKTVRGEEGMEATVTDKGMTINGELVMRGARIGQIVNTMDDKVIFLYQDMPNGQLHFIALGPPASGWGDFKLDRCP